MRPGYFPGHTNKSPAGNCYTSALPEIMLRRPQILRASSGPVDPPNASMSPLLVGISICRDQQETSDILLFFINGLLCKFQLSSGKPAVKTTRTRLACTPSSMTGALAPGVYQVEQGILLAVPPPFDQIQVVSRRSSIDP